ncbi:hypothetical protein ABZW03_26255 [Kitasatospora sp. NPDC004799]|uniref:hypothetical protein n=1 Tax=Kitasatospora sp. NPDC004799 TaxID=3154460 RepID=UPI0033B41C6A
MARNTSPGNGHVFQDADGKPLHPAAVHTIETRLHLAEARTHCGTDALAGPLPNPLLSHAA